MNKNLLFWLIYDSANSFLTVAIGGLFLAQWVILDNKFDDLWYGGIFALATVLVLITSPFWGAWSDSLGKRLPFIKWQTVFLILTSGLLVLAVTSALPAGTKVVLVLGLALAIQYFYQVSLIFYNALLGKISTPQTRGKISGLGELFGNLGWIIGSAIFLPFASGKITIIGESGRSQVFLPAFILWTVFALPMLFWFKEKNGTVRRKSEFNFRAIYQKTTRGLKELFRKNRNVAVFLVAFSFISDAVLTIQLYFAVAMDRLYRVSDTEKFYFLTFMFLVVMVSDYLLGILSDRKGTKKILVFSCLILILIFTIASLSSDPKVLYLVALVAGIGYGGFYVASRALLVKISPLNQLGEYFGFYSVFYRFASIIGPIVWGIITLVLKSYGDIKYRVAMLALVSLMVIGVLLLTKVQEERVLT